MMARAAVLFLGLCAVPCLAQDMAELRQRCLDYGLTPGTLGYAKCLRAPADPVRLQNQCASEMMMRATGGVYGAHAAVLQCESDPVAHLREKPPTFNCSFNRSGFGGVNGMTCQ